jgi:hypothetical protein
MIHKHNVICHALPAMDPGQDVALAIAAIPARNPQASPSSDHTLKDRNRFGNTPMARARGGSGFLEYSIDSYVFFSPEPWRLSAVRRAPGGLESVS